MEAGLTRRFELPFPPSVNHYWRRVGERTLISREGRRFRQRVHQLLSAIGVRPLDGRLAIHVEAWPPDRRRRDIDNIAKALLDALEHAGAYRDDAQIDRLLIERRDVVAEGRTVVLIKEMPNDATSPLPS